MWFIKLHLTNVKNNKIKIHHNGYQVKFQPAWHSNTGSTNGMSFGRGYLFVWAMEDKASVQEMRFIIFKIPFGAQTTHFTLATKEQHLCNKMFLRAFLS